MRRGKPGGLLQHITRRENNSTTAKRTTTSVVSSSSSRSNGLPGSTGAGVGSAGVGAGSAGAGSVEAGSDGMGSGVASAVGVVFEDSTKGFFSARGEEGIAEGRGGGDFTSVSSDG